MVEFIAERRVAAVSPDGEKLVLRIAVGQPYQVDEDSWACPVSIEGLYVKLRDAVGYDSWQALSLAIALVRQLLGYFLNDGGKLYWKEENSEMTIDDLFPLFPLVSP